MKRWLSIIFWPITAPIVFIQNHFKATLLVIILILVFAGGESMPAHNLYRIDLRGPILGSDAFLEAVAEAGEPEVKGVLLVIDSPGGVVAPSVEMKMAIEALARKKPVVSYAAGTMASGSYWSIGVILQITQADALMEKIGVGIKTVTKGAYKEAGAFYKPMSAREEAELQRVVDHQYRYFVEDVCRARGLNENEIHTFADGHIFTAPEALELGLIDRLGSLEEAKALTAEAAGVATPVWNEPSKMERWMEQVAAEGAAAVVTGAWSGLLQRVSFQAL